MENIKEIDVYELQKKRQRKDNFLLLDVREKIEYQTSHLNGLNIPLSELEKRFNELEPYKQREIVVMCRRGIRSKKAMMILHLHGFQNMHNLAGGITAWKHAFDPNMIIY